MASRRMGGEREMTVMHKRADGVVTTGDDPGVFDLLLSSAALDRDGERLLPSQWKQPLPESIPLNIDHSGSVSDVVGSGRPWFDAEGNLRVSGRWASTEKAQEVRTLVNEGHVISCSVEFLRSTVGGEPVRELTGAALVLTPSNREARVMSSKSKSTGLEDTATGSALLQAIHDASLHLGARCVDDVDDEAAKAAALRLRLKALRS